MDSGAETGEEQKQSEQDSQQAGALPCATFVVIGRAD
jgi:hypothetical protein